ncbi:TatD family deoxyribonuclease [Candidatus Shapirobacteria bacterium]|nr:TatD family deoxyribonuclease [Candidatus Shapirobacteria bacterium]
MKNFLVDTHAHLNFPDYQNDLGKVIKDSLKNGVKMIICVSSNLADAKKAIEIAKKYPGIVYAAVGIHPQKTDKNPDSPAVQLGQLAQLAQSPEVVAVGECGLDFSPAPPGEEDRPKEEQLFLFEEQIELALKLALPINVHSRKASDETLGVLEKHFNLSNRKLKGVWHCYSGGKGDIKKVTEIGFFFGIDGNLTYDSGLQNVVMQIPLEKIVLETDCPFLSPAPFRGLRNSPGNVRIITEFLANLKGASFAEVSHVTSKNAKELFSKIR